MLYPDWDIIRIRIGRTEGSASVGTGTVQRCPWDTGWEGTEGDKASVGTYLRMSKDVLGIWDGKDRGIGQSKDVQGCPWDTGWGKRHQ